MTLLRPRSLSSLTIRRRKNSPTTATLRRGSSDSLDNENSAFAAFDTDIIRSFDGLELYDGVKNFGRQKLRAALERNKEEAKKFQKRLKERRRKFQEQLRTPEFYHFKDKISFIIGLGALLITQGFLLKAPQFMWAWYAGLILPLLITRYVLYRQSKYNYFCYDFCYAVQATLCLSLFTPLGKNLCFHRVNFAVANGPLAFAAAIWRNSLVFHSLDKQTSLFIHMIPSMVTYCLRWHGSLHLKYISNDSINAPVADTASTDLLWGFLWAPLILYVGWQVLYLLKTEVISKQKLERDEELMTSKRWLTKEPNSKIYNLINYFGPQHQTATFVALQLFYTMATLIPTVFLYRSQTAHIVVLLILFGCCMWNGANYYFVVFASRYIIQLQKLKETYEREMGGEEEGIRSSDDSAAASSTGSVSPPTGEVGVANGDVSPIMSNSGDGDTSSVRESRDEQDG